MPTGIRPPGRAAPYELITMADFRGGLNRSDDMMNVGENEVLDIENFDLDPQGGLSTRPGTARAVTDMTDKTGSLLAGRVMLHLGYYGDSQDGEKILIGKDQSRPAVIWSPTSGGTRTLTGHNASMAYRLGTSTYIPSHPGAGTTCAVIPDGDIMAGTIATRTELYEDDYESPSTSGHPPTRYACVQHYRAWVVDETEVNRVRFSHPGTAQYWHSTDFVELGAQSSDIVGLWALGDIVLALKQDSVWFIQGDVLAAIRVQQVDEMISTNFTEAYGAHTSTMALGRVWIWAKGDGLVSIGPQLDIVRHSEKLRNLDELPDIKSISAASGKIYCRTRPGTTDETFVYDPALDGWTVYDISMIDALDATIGSYDASEGKVTVFLDGERVDGNNDNYVMYQDPSAETDTRGAGAVVTPVTVKVRTPWLVGGAPTERKKWGRPRVLVESVHGSDSTGMTIKLYKNFEEALVTTATRDLEVATDGAVLSVRGPSAGTADGVSYEFASTDTCAIYLHAIAPRFRPQRIRR